MLPFDEKPWAKSLAKFVIAFTLLAELAVVLWRLKYAELDTAEITGLLLILVAVIPPNVHIIRRKQPVRVSDALGLQGGAIPLGKQNHLP